MHKNLLLTLLLVLTTLSIGCNQTDEKGASQPEGLDYEAVYNEGLNLLESEEYELAIEKFEILLDHSSDELTLLNLSKAHFSLEQYDEAKDYIIRSIENNTVDTSEEHRIYGDVLYALDDMDLAVEQYILATQLDETNGYAWYGLGLYYESLEQHVQYIEAFEKAAKYSEDIKIYIHLLDAYINTNNPLSYNKTIANLYAKYPNNYDIAKHYGKSLDLQFKKDEALEHYKSMEAEFDHPDANMLVPEYLYELSRLEACIEHMTSNDPYNQSQAFIELYANAYFALNKFEEALKVADEVINRNSDDYFGYFLKGKLYYHYSNYVDIESLEKATEYLEKAAELKDAYEIYEFLVMSLYYSNGKENNQAIIDLAKSCYNHKKYDAALSFIEQAIEFEPKSNTIEEYLLLCDILIHHGRVDDAVSALNKANDLSEKDIALEHLLSIDTDQMDDLSFYYYVDTLDSLTSTEETIAAIDKWIDTHQDNFWGYYKKGQTLYASGYHYEAIEPFEKAIELKDEAGIYDLLFYAYFSSDRLFKAQDLAYEKMDKFYDAYVVKYNLARTYSYLTEFEKSIEIFEELLITDPHNKYSEYIKYYLAKIYYDLGDNDKALEYINQYVNQDNDTDKLVLDLKNEITKIEAIKDDVSYIHQLFSDYYMYEPNYDALDGLSGDLSNEEAYELLNAIKDEDDPFTFLLYGDYYDYFERSESVLEYKDLGNKVHYVKIKKFTQTINFEFLQAIDTIVGPESSTLIIDLRDNGGGHLNSTISILDYLIGEATICIQKYKNDPDTYHESDPSKMDFKEIYVLVNNHSASSSEVLALSLDVHLNNVTLVGEQTFGKGVGQQIIDDKKNKRKYFIVNHYWFVGDTNVQDVGITPEIYVENDKIDSYMMDLLNLTDF